MRIEEELRKMTETKIAKREEILRDGKKLRKRNFLKTGGQLMKFLPNGKKCTLFGPFRLAKREKTFFSYN